MDGAKYGEIPEGNLSETSRYLKRGHFSQDNDPEQTAEAILMWFKEEQLNVPEWSNQPRP